MYKLKNLAKGTLNAQLLSGGTSLTLESGEGAKFPDTGSDNVFVGVLWGSDFVSPEADSNAEFVTAYRTSGDTFTIVRAQEGTSASQWESGDLFSLVASSAVLNRLIPWADSQTVKTSNYTFTGAEEMNSCWNGSTSGGSLTFSVNPNLFSTGFELHFSKGTADANTLTLDAGSGNNINGSQTFVISRQYAVITLIKDGANTWRVKSSYPSVTYPSGSIVGNSDSQTLTNKTIDADDNTISNLETDNFKSGVIDTDDTLSADSDTKIPTQKAVKGYADTKESLSNKSTNTSLGTSNTLYPTQNAVKTYVDNNVSGSTKTARVYNTTTQSIPSGSPRVLTFNAETFDTDSIHSTVTNNSRLTAKTAGTYLVTAQVSFDSNSSGRRQTILMKNGSYQIGSLETPPISGSQTIQQASGLVRLVVNDYVEVTAYQTSGSTIGVGGGDTYNGTHLEMIRLGA